MLVSRNLHTTSPKHIYFFNTNLKYPISRSSRKTTAGSMSEISDLHSKSKRTVIVYYFSFSTT
uniref:Uncharacterized protein n=1 Tax=Rhizophora mucronata TaxID=61149 RepID=A0A2P2LIG7_RHIMU